MDNRTMNDAAAGNLVAGIAKVAPNGALMQIPSIATSFAALVKKAQALSTSVSAVAADEKQLQLDITARDQSRTALHVELGTYGALVGNFATSEADITGMGLQLLPAVTSTRTVPDAPASLRVKIGKAHGKARVAVEGGPRGRFVAEYTLDPTGAGPWVSLPGNGKERKLAFPTGTKVWVHFAQVRYGMQSPWSTAVLVTMP
jgi:hypothetical protein